MVVVPVSFLKLWGIFYQQKINTFFMNIKKFIFYFQNFVKTWFIAMVKQHSFISMPLIWLHWLHENCATRALW